MMDHAEAQELLPVHALDALDAGEAASLEEHLETCPRCPGELSAYREIAAILGDSGTRAPTGLWDRIADSLEETPPVLSLENFKAPSRWSRRNGLGGRMLAGLAAAAVVIAAVLTIDVVGLQHRNNQVTAEPTMKTVAAALATPGADQSILHSPGGKLSLTAVVLPSGAGYLFAPRLPRLPSSETYQLWGVSNDKTVSYGLLGSDPAIVPFRVGAGTTELAVTREKAGGAPAPTHAALITGIVRSAA